MRSHRLATAFALALVCAVTCRASADDQPTEEQVRFFETRIRPVLVEHCHDCHGPDAQESDLRLDSAAALHAGGKAGPTLVPGKPEQSLLVTAIGYRDSTLQMPPDGKLTDQQVADLTEWVRSGARWPGESAMAVKPQAVDLATARDFWSLQPVADPPVPEVRDAAWPKTPIDRFILARLEQEGLRPAPPADRRTLIRRATFDLTGLPPTPEEIEAFLAEESSDAFAKVIDRLLASPGYGERWGRHWLDVARYADSNGLDENVAHGNAWRYRDYVIDSLNADKPYDRFLTEQLAGDLLPAETDEVRNEQLVATGFLALGPKVLAEVDEQKMEMDIVDEQIDTVGRSLLGLTLGCARCHDHKFDPLLTADYYALAGIFKSTKTMDSFTKIAKWHENPVPTADDLRRKDEFDAQLAARKQSVEAFVAAANAALQSKLGEGAALPEKPETQYPAETQEELKKLREALAAFEKDAPVIPAAMGASEGEVTNAAIHVRGSHLTLGDVVPRRFPLALAGEDQPPLPETSSGRLALAEWMTGPEHPLTSRVMVNRIWRWHFGQGLVRTPDNFGRLGERPTHPELLDWLARRFIENGWSVKAMHRLIMLSSVYQQSSSSSELGTRNAEPTASESSSAPSSLDPENRLYWRMDVRRLEAEELRDALLAVSGRLERSMHGSLLNTANRVHVFDHTSKDNTSYDTDRRSVYLPVIRNNVYDLFQLFDYADESAVTGDRPTSTVAPQALFLLNSEFVVSVSDSLTADLLTRDGVDDVGRVDLLYRRACGRPADDAEIARAETMLARFDEALTATQPDTAQRRQLAWAALCQAVLISNEFISVR